MSETLQIWLFGGMAAWLLILTGGLFRLWITTTQVQTMMMMTSVKAAEILHSPNDHLGIDSLLEKYIDRHYELSFQEWMELKEKTEAITNDSNNPKSERMLAAFIYAVCCHKCLMKANNYKFDP